MDCQEISSFLSNQRNLRLTLLSVSTKNCRPVQFVLKLLSIVIKRKPFPNRLITRENSCFRLDNHCCKISSKSAFIFTIYAVFCFLLFFCKPNLFLFECPFTCSFENLHFCVPTPLISQKPRITLTTTLVSLGTVYLSLSLNSGHGRKNIRHAIFLERRMLQPLKMWQSTRYQTVGDESY